MLIELAQCLCHQMSADLRQLVRQFACGLAFYRGALRRQHRSCVKACLHLHNRDARYRIARHNRAVDWGRPAPARQDRGVDVETAFSGRIKHGLRQD